MTMQALVLTDYNTPLEQRTLARPTPKAGEVLVRIKASGLNPLDLKIRGGAAEHAKHPLPLVLGIDMAGIVEAIGAGVSGFKTGDEVFGMTGGVGGIQGSLAQYAVVDARLLARKPKNLSMKAAAALPLSFITSYQGIVDRARLQAHQTILIQGGAGGVGHVSVQLAVASGARVFATASAKDHDLIRSFGATPIDYKTQTVDDYITRFTDGAGFDIVADTVGGATLDASFAAVKQFGHVVSALGWGTHSLAPLSFREASYSGVFTLDALLTGRHRAHHGEIVTVAAKLAEAGKLSPRVDPRHFDLSTADEAYLALASGATQGKIIIEVE